MNVLLLGVVGSQAYGLAHADSDTDRLGVYAEDTVNLHGLKPPTDTYVGKNPDLTMHEAAKACRLMLQCNPTVMEILWLQDYEVRTELGQELIDIRESFLSAKRVRDAYLGYATQQFKRLTERGRFGADIPDSRIPKHARHMYRLVDQGIRLYTTGELRVKLANPEACRVFGEQVAADPRAAEPLMHSARTKLEKWDSALPQEPDTDTVDKWLKYVRSVYWEMN